MKWKWVRIGLFFLVLLVILIPSILYVSNIDLSKSYTANVEKLSQYDADKENGIYLLEANELEFKIRIAGFQNTGDNIIFLHGFPQTSIIWEPVMEEAASQGFRAAAFDQRGYSPGARPKGVAQYDIDFLVDDLLDVADAIGFDTFHLVGHDWGAAVGWKSVMNHPERMATWTALSIPHNTVFQEALRNNPDQQKRSSYMSLLQKPIIPELLFVLNQDKGLEELKGVWRDEEIAEVKSLFSEHGALTAALNWYRSAGESDNQMNTALEKIETPTLFIWGNKDPVVSAEIIPLQKPLMGGPYYELELDAGHSLVQEKKDSVIGAMLEHWKQH